jgi:hypothetical protein
MYSAWPLYADNVETVHYKVGTANIDEETRLLLKSVHCSISHGMAGNCNRAFAHWPDSKGRLLMHRRQSAVSETRLP